MNRSITFFVFATPAPQPRPRMTRTGRAYNPPTADAWKKAVREAWAALNEEPMSRALIMRLEFEMERPKSHWTKKASLTVSAPTHHTQKPDVDNLAKSTMDALENAGAFPGDAYVTSLTASKRWKLLPSQGCRITITERD